ncbi:hypothetical protein [Homoserinibacter sp. YIM 151385]|uniref:hypothetical protein n=1 Tax=Homoserinibacter sp. YIM 151385 TaxID=2985506 RepID=UPI0022F0CBE1|nr:hypothetical protein [Homoserinibacter sp. YIM 151385]WBU38446.1 hypothetical protein OF852_02345 [Homoserinibacter sp. YIM 151385]
MPTTLAMDIFRRLMTQVDEVESAAAEADLRGAIAGPILRRSGYVLTVAALDSYFHERGIEMLATYARSGTTPSVTVANYVGSVAATVLAGPTAESHVRLRLSFKTLVAPDKIDSMIIASGRDPGPVWMNVAMDVASRPDRLRRLSELVFDRRNQIAHEADWDVGRLDFRPMYKSTLDECREHVTTIVEGFETHL